MSRKEYHVYYHGKKEYEEEQQRLRAQNYTPPPPPSGPTPEQIRAAKAEDQFLNFLTVVVIVGIILCWPFITWVFGILWTVFYYVVIVPIGFVIAHWLVILITFIVGFFAIGIYEASKD